MYIYIYNTYIVHIYNTYIIQINEAIGKVFEDISITSFNRTRNFRDRDLLGRDTIVNGKVKKTRHQQKRDMLPMLQQEKHNVL